MSHHIIFEIIMCNATFQSNIIITIESSLQELYIANMKLSRIGVHIHTYTHTVAHRGIVILPPPLMTNLIKARKMCTQIIIHYTMQTVSQMTYIHHVDSFTRVSMQHTYIYTRVNTAHIHLHACQCSTHTFTRVSMQHTYIYTHMHRPLPPPHAQGCSIFGTFSCPMM